MLGAVGWFAYVSSGKAEIALCQCTAIPAKGNLTLVIMAMLTISRPQALP